MVNPTKFYSIRNGSNKYLRFLRHILPYAMRRYLNKARQIGFESSDRSPYKQVMASTRLRVYDVIKNFRRDEDYSLGWYSPKRKYDMVIFQKHFSADAYELAKKIQSSGVKVVLDINVDFYNKSAYILPYEFDDAFKFTEIADAVLTTTEYLKEIISRSFPNKKIFVIAEGIDNSYFKVEKKFFNIPLNLIWCGYSSKAKEILLISDVLKELHDDYKFTIILITEKDPLLSIGNIPIQFLYYEHSKVPDLLVKGDIFIAPRDLTNTYNLGHSFTKIGIAMAVGLPVISSPVPSYIGSPAVLCNGKAEWKINLARMLTDLDYLKVLGNMGRNFVRDCYSPRRIKEKYKLFFDEMLR